MYIYTNVECLEADEVVIMLFKMSHHTCSLSVKCSEAKLCKAELISNDRSKTLPSPFSKIHLVFVELGVETECESTDFHRSTDKPTLYTLSNYLG